MAELNQTDGQSMELSRSSSDEMIVGWRAAASCMAAGLSHLFLKVLRVRYQR